MVQCTELVADAASAVVVKRATGAAGVARLRAEAHRLQIAAHPGVVELLSSSGTDDRWELRLAHAGRPLDLVGAMPVAQVAGVVAAAAATLADLHESGVVHGRVDASHLLIGEHGRPVLCGLGAAPPGSTPADDVAALGGLLAALLGSALDMEPIPERRWSRRSWSGWERRSLLLLADQALADPPTRRPTARRLAAAIAEAVPGAGVATPAPAAPLDAVADDAPSATDPMAALRATARTEVPRPAPRLPALAGALVGIMALGVGALGLVTGRDAKDGPPPALVDEQPSGAVSDVSAPATTTTVDLLPTTTVPPVPCVVLPGTATASGTCVEPVRVVGTTVYVGAHRFEVGQPGDLVVLGDWDCDGGATPAVLRPGTGDVFVFTAWATGGAVEAPSSARVRDATGLLVQTDADGCTVLLAQSADGSRRAVATERAA